MTDSNYLLIRMILSSIVCLTSCRSVSDVFLSSWEKICCVSCINLLVWWYNASILFAQKSFWLLMSIIRVQIISNSHFASKNLRSTITLDHISNDQWRVLTMEYKIYRIDTSVHPDAQPLTEFFHLIGTFY